MENVSEVLADASAKIDKSFETLKSQFAGLRTGKASPALVDGIKVDYYGAPTPLKNLATISTPEPRQIKIAPFDPSILGEMNKAILAANLGVTPQNDGRVLRITIPELNEERRKEIVKVAKKQAEEAHTASYCHVEQELEAYRRAERMERMARERAEQVYSLTNGILADASAQVDGVADQIGNLADTVMLQLEQLKGVVGSSKEALKSASESLYSLRPEEN